MSQLDAYVRTSLKPRHLQLLVALDDIRHLGKVAASMNVSQPAVSKSLGELERGLGLRLFERTARGVNPTAYGQCLIRHARVMLGELAQTRDELQGLASGGSGSIRVGVLATAALELLPRALAAFKARQPGVFVLVREGIMETLLPDLWLGNLDIIVGRLPQGGAQGLGEKTLMEEGVSVVTGRHHPLAQCKHPSWSDLHQYPWVVPPVNTLLREPLERLFHDHALALPADRIETLSVHVIRAYLHHTNAIAALATDVSRYYESLGMLAVLPIELPKLVRPVGIIWNHQRPVSPSTQALIGSLEDAARHIKRPTSGKGTRPALAERGETQRVPRAMQRTATPRVVRQSRPAVARSRTTA